MSTPVDRSRSSVRLVQSRTVRTLATAQVVGGVGGGAGLSVGALLVKEISGSSAWAGLATTMLTLGAAAGSLPLASLAARRGRRPSLTVGWLGAAVGAVIVMIAARLDSLPLTLVGLLVCGLNTATNLQSRYAAADLAEPSKVGRSLSLVVWSTTVGAVLGPNLTGPGGRVAGVMGLPALAGPFVFSAVSFLGAGLIMSLALRPDPLLLAREIAASEETVGSAATGQAASGGRSGWARARRAIARSPGALTGIVAIACSHAVMVSVMAMTPVHMQDRGATLSIVGLTISLHIAGMFALSPVMGWLSDRRGWRPTLVGGQMVLLVAALVAGTSGESEVRITIGLVLLGVGWSASLIAGSALVTQSVAVADRAGVQGIADLTMNLAGAGGGLLAGVVVAGLGFGPLNAVAALLTIPVIARALATRVQPTAAVDA